MSLKKMLSEIQVLCYLLLTSSTSVNMWNESGGGEFWGSVFELDEMYDGKCLQIHSSTSGKDVSPSTYLEYRSVEMSWHSKSHHIWSKKTSQNKWECVTRPGWSDREMRCISFNKFWMRKWKLSESDWESKNSLQNQTNPSSSYQILLSNRKSLWDSSISSKIQK